MSLQPLFVCFSMCAEYTGNGPKNPLCSVLRESVRRCFGGFFLRAHRHTHLRLRRDSKTSTKKVKVGNCKVQRAHFQVTAWCGNKPQYS